MTPDAENERKNSKGKKRIAIVYHYFQHYRKGIFRELENSHEFEFEFYADEKNMYHSGVAPWQKSPGTIFHRTRCFLMPLGLMWQTGLIRLALRRDIDGVIYFGNAYYLATWLSSILCRITKKRVLFWTQGWLKPESGFKVRIRTTFYRRADAMMVYGHFAKQLAIQNGLPPSFVHVVFNSLDYPEHRSLRQKYENDNLIGLRRELFRAPELPIVICSTRLIERRRLDWLIEAASRLGDEGHRMNVLIVGDGPEQDSLRKLAASQDVDIHFFGPCYDEETLCKLHRISCVTVAPGMVGLTAVHSMTYGVPVITQNDPYEQMPEWEAIVPDQTGDVFDNNNVDDLMRLLKKWTNSNEVDQATRQHCIDIIERFYNPVTQRKTFERALNGLPADDLMRESAAGSSGKNA